MKNCARMRSGEIRILCHHFTTAAVLLKSSSMHPDVVTVVSGSVAIVGENLVVYPLQYIKTQQQIHSCGAAAASAGVATARPYGTVADVVRSTLASRGVTGFYSGLSPFLLFAVPRGTTRFLTFDACNSRLRGAGVPARCAWCGLSRTLWS
jgi:solute carrier family 25 citrate transporter 1